MAADENMAWARRNHNLRRLWEPLHALGFSVVDEAGSPVAREGALERRRAVSLQRVRGPLALRERTGFFTHSLIGNALILLVGQPSVELFGSSRSGLTLDMLAKQPNRHYLQNASPLDLGGVVLVRHGLTEANQCGIALGRSDGAVGWRGEVVERFERAAPADVCSWHRSTLLRTHQTASMFGVEDSVPHGALDEMDIGAAEGIEESTVINSFVSAQLMYYHGDPFAAIIDEFRGDSLQGAGECFVEVLLRVAECLQSEMGAS